MLMPLDALLLSAQKLRELKRSPKKDQDDWTLQPEDFVSLSSVGKFEQLCNSYIRVSCASIIVALFTL